jgi:hypothetical protein
MRAPMGYRLVLIALFALAAAACGKEIGDECVLSSDCSPNGDRVCLCSSCAGSVLTDSEQGYCTVIGCDYSTCPEEAACIRFFTGDFDNRLCDPDVAQADCNADPKGSLVCCSLDELCAINGHCVPRASEVRYCMKSCGSNGDCRDGYECRDFEMMKDHGGQPLLSPGTPVDASHAPKFCAAAPR